MIFFALIVSIVFALIKEGGTRAQIKYGISLFLSLVLGAILFGWVMYFLR
jgi:ABC-type uncharacterized transport system permease subunit